MCTVMMRQALRTARHRRPVAADGNGLSSEDSKKVQKSRGVEGWKRLKTVLRKSGHDLPTRAKLPDLDLSSLGSSWCVQVKNFGDSKFFSSIIL